MQASPYTTTHSFLQQPGHSIKIIMTILDDNPIKSAKNTAKTLAKNKQLFS
jgi:hypothetical protein